MIKDFLRSKRVEQTKIEPLALSATLSISFVLFFLM